MATTSPYHHDLTSICSTSPIIVNHTNMVSVSLVANCLLAMGASPLMTQSAEEVDALMQLAQALVLNAGTSNMQWELLAQSLLKSAHRHHKPVILDPVGAGASSYRRRLNLALLEAGVDVVRGNASEILALADAQIKAGIDSNETVNHAVSAAKKIANTFGCLVIVSGEVDLITDGAQFIENNDGTPMLKKITGAGCALTAIIGAFLAINNDYLSAAVHAVEYYTQAAERAVEQSHGPGDFQIHLLNHLYQMIHV